MSASWTILFTAVHMGPYLSISPLEQEFGSEKVLFLIDGPAKEARRASGQAYREVSNDVRENGTLRQFLKKRGVRAIITGTSDGLAEGNIEEQAAVAATEEAIPLFVVEDFPGNYRRRSGIRLDGLFVENGSQREMHASRGVPRERIHCTGNPRYDSLHRVDRDTLRGNTRMSLQTEKRRAVLWVGQPDEARSYEALKRLLPALAREEVAVLFKAHPRDRRYGEGAYKPLLSSLAWCRDVTLESETISLCCAADLVVTQFSSVGVEASYLGTPVLYVLFDDLGMAYLREHKGYEVVPWARENCAFLLRSSDSIQGKFETALFDDGARSEVQQRFKDRFGSRPPGAPAIASIVNRSLCGSA